MALRWLAVLCFLAATATTATAAPSQESLGLGKAYRAAFLDGEAQAGVERWEARRAYAKVGNGTELGVTALDLVQDIAEFHPETDRWTERNNRIRLSLLMGGWFYSNELDIENNFMTGLRVSWEAPGFIAIHFDVSGSPFSRLEVKPGGSGNPASSRHADGLVTSYYVAVGIFNPELSSETMAWWAGLGLGVWRFSFDESNVQGNTGVPTNVSWDEITFAGKVFVEVDFKLSDTFHVGIGITEHILYADYTDEGRFYNVNGVQGGIAGGGSLTQKDRNDGIIGHLAVITELTLNLSIVF